MSLPNRENSTVHVLSRSPILSVRDLHVTFPSEAGRVDAVRGVSFDLSPGQTLGIVGESGSGKSVTSLAIMGLLAKSARVSGSIELDGQQLVGKTENQLAKIRGNDIAMIFQDPLSSLTPVFSIGDQLIEAIQIHRNVSRAEAFARGVELLSLVGIPNPQIRMKSFPHEFSGGMRQRVMIAIAIANDPKVIIADEPTTALDVTIQAQVLELLQKAQQETGAAMIMITHDMGVVARTADDVLVMYAGRPVEKASARELFARPRMPYTIGLLGAIPRADTDSDAALVPIEGNPPILINLPDACPFAARCPVVLDDCRHAEPALESLSADHSAACIRAHEISDRQIGGQPVFKVPEIQAGKITQTPREGRKTVLEVSDLVREFPLMKGAILKRRVGTVHAVNGVSFEIKEGETFAVVGESGSGKTTTLLAIMDLAKEASGRILLNDVDLKALRGPAKIRKIRRDIQIVFQDPMGALDPRLTVSDIIAEPMRAFGFDKARITDRVAELMETVGLNPAHVDRFPGAFSGGQRQRIGIARALASEPNLLVLDEPVSALDVSIQAGVINLLQRLKQERGLAYLFVAHDLSVVRHLADRIAVMYLGRFVETGTVAEVFDHPKHPYTEALISAIPVPDPEIERTRQRILLEGDLPSPTENLPGCRFVSRCPLYATLPSDKQHQCTAEVPALTRKEGVDHHYACHHR